MKEVISSTSLMQHAVHSGSGRPVNRCLLPLLSALLLQAATITDVLAQDREQPGISLDWIHQKDSLGIDDPHKKLPGRLRWSPAGHVLAFEQATDLYGSVLVVLDADDPANRIVLTAQQVAGTPDSLGDEGYEPEGRLDFIAAIAEEEGKDLDDEAPQSPDEVEQATDEAMQSGDADPDESETTDSAGESDETEEKLEIKSFSWLDHENRLRIQVGDRTLIFDPIGYRIYPKSGIPIRANRLRILQPICTSVQHMLGECRSAQQVPISMGECITLASACLRIRSSNIWPTMHTPG